MRRVVDGDTLVLSNDERVRLIGVDTPEVHESAKLYRDAERTEQDVTTIRALGKQASAFTKSLIPSGTQVRLEYDQQPRDKYNRLLAFVWLPDGRMVNETIICEGYANAYTRYPFKQEYYIDRFRACERQALVRHIQTFPYRLPKTVRPCARHSSAPIHGAACSPCCETCLTCRSLKNVRDVMILDNYSTGAEQHGGVDRAPPRRSVVHGLRGTDRGLQRRHGLPG